MVIIPRLILMQNNAAVTQSVDNPAYFQEKILNKSSRYPEKRATKFDRFMPCIQKCEVWKK